MSRGPQAWARARESASGPRCFLGTLGHRPRFRRGALRLIGVSQVHVDGCIYTGPASLRFAEQLVQWGAKVRAASTWTGPWPIVSIWHGDADYTVRPANLTESLEQWADVHGIDAVADASDTVSGYPHRVYKNAGGTAKVETYVITGMGHGTPVDPGSGEGGAKGLWRKIGAIGIEQRRMRQVARAGDAAIGANGQKLRPLLLALGQVQHLERVRQRQLFERDGNFVPIGRGGGVEVDHEWPC